MALPLQQQWRHDTARPQPARRPRTAKAQRKQPRAA